MGSGVVTIGRRSYAVGLYWENSPGSRVVAAAKEAASQAGQFYAIRAGQKDGRVPQFGLGQAASGHQPNMAAFAGCLANQQPGSWVGAFRMREGTVVTVVRDDLIVPDGDQLFVDENDARERLLQEVSFGGLQRVFAPESWAIPGSDNMPVSLLMDERRDVKLKAAAISNTVWMIAGGIAILVVIGIAVGLYMQNEAEKRAAEIEQLNALARAREAANQMGLGEQKPPPYPPPVRYWEFAPPVENILEACRSGLANIPAAIAGWRLEDVKCNGQSLSIDWAREHGYSVPPKDWILDSNGSIASSSVPLPKLNERGHEDLANPDDITRRYFSQNWPGTVQRLPDDPPPPPPPDYKGPWNPPPPPWVKRSFTLTVSDLPALMLNYFRDMPGVVINSITFRPSSTIMGTWNVEGIIYENRL